MMKIFFSALIFLQCCLGLTTQTYTDGPPSVNDIGSSVKRVYTQQDSLIFEKYVSRFSSSKETPIADLTIATAFFFKNTPYVSETLDQNKNEHLVINLHQFDCTTFVESCLALVHTIRSSDPSFENYCTQLQKIRYRNGDIKDYPSRLHYSSDWAFENQKQGLLKNMSKEMNGVLVKKMLNFMSTHPEDYPMLKGDSTAIHQIARIESKINQRGGYYIVPKEILPTVVDQFKNGDIIIFATRAQGIDFSHMGFAYKNGSKLTFIDASSRSMKVVEEMQSLADYCNRSKSCTGVLVLRQIK